MTTNKKNKTIDTLGTLEDFKNALGDKVWVKCVTDIKPWANETPLLLWQNYFISTEEAFALEEKKFAVILFNPDNYT